MYYPNGLGPLLKLDQRHGRNGWVKEEIMALCRLSNLPGQWSHGTWYSVVIHVQYGSPFMTQPGKVKLKGSFNILYFLLMDSV